MRFSSIQFLATAFALNGAAIATISGPFYLTIVPEDGSASYPATVAIVSRGAEILSSALDYTQQYIFNSTSSRIFKADEPTNGNGPLNVGAPLLFNNPGGSGSAIEQVTSGGKVYLVKAGTAALGIYAWWSAPTPTGLPVQVNWQGVSSADANAAVRVDVTAP